jgi:murein L,D-transpeptidase YcbB/YkuD
VISGLLHTVVLNPYWTVPTNIALRDLIPKQRNDPDYMPVRNIRVFDDWEGSVELDPATIDWSKISRENFPYMLRQDPGPHNPLGRVKILFSNDFNVYLHDTPSRYLFQRNERAFSSGCVRVEDAVRLTSYLLAGENSWDLKSVQAAIDSGQTVTIDVKRAVNVYLLYLTTWVDADGTVQFRPDIYGEDAKLACCRNSQEPIL